MPVESATGISGLNAAWPLHTDGFNQFDSHVRLIKQTVLNTFPSITDPVTTTSAQLNALPTVTAQAAAALPAAGGSITGSLTLPTPGAYIGCEGVINGGSIQQNGSPLVPSGIIALWSGAATAIPGGWLLCDGTNGTPDLRDRFVIGAQGSFPVGGVGGSFNPTLTTTAAGLHVHGGATGATGGHTHGVSIEAAGTHTHSGSTAATVLTVDQIPSHAHPIVHINGVTPNGAPSIAGSAGGAGTYTDYTSAVGGGLGHTHGIVADGTHAHIADVTAVGDHAHTVAADGNHSHTISAPPPPYYALCYIMKA